MQEAQINYDNLDKTEIARFIVALTGSNWDEVYSRVRNPYGKKSENEDSEPSEKENKAAQKDLMNVKAYFEKLGLLQVVKKIERELDIG